MARIISILNHIGRYLLWRSTAAMCSAGSLTCQAEGAGFAVIEVGDTDSLSQPMIKRVPELFASDVRLPGDSFLVLLERSRSVAVPPALIVITAFGTIEQAVDALRRGADDFLTKPNCFDHRRYRPAPPRIRGGIGEVPDVG